LVQIHGKLLLQLLWMFVASRYAGNIAKVGITSKKQPEDWLKKQLI